MNFKTTLRSKFAQFRQLDRLCYPILQLKVHNRTFALVQEYKLDFSLKKDYIGGPSSQVGSQVGQSHLALSMCFCICAQASAYHRTRTPSLLFKLHISMALDLVWQLYLFELLQYRGFHHGGVTGLLLFSHFSTRYHLQFPAFSIVSWNNISNTSTVFGKKPPFLHTCSSWPLTLFSGYSSLVLMMSTPLSNMADQQSSHFHLMQMMPRPL